MIGKITVGKSFRGCIAYCLTNKIQKQDQGQVVKDKAEVLMFNKMLRKCEGIGEAIQ
jgi:hypothetical protein